MAYYNTCPSCGSNLDPGEQCDCLRPDEGAQIGHSSSQQAREMEFLTGLRHLRLNCPPRFIALLAVLNVIANGESENFGFQYPRKVLLESTEYLENSRQQRAHDPDMVDIFDKSLALIRNKWINQAPDAV